MSIRLLRSILLLFFACFLLNACADETPTPSTKPRTTGNPVVNTAIVEASVEEQEEAPYVYNPTGTRDPFKNPLDIFVEIPLGDAVVLTPLQKFDLGQLRVIGVIIGKGEPKAMVIAPDDKSFILKKGTKVGRNNGVVTGITTVAILVEEQFLDFTGEIKIKTQEIMLPKQGGVK